MRQRPTTRAFLRPFLAGWFLLQAAAAVAPEDLRGREIFMFSDPRTHTGWTVERLAHCREDDHGSARIDAGGLLVFEGRLTTPGAVPAVRLEGPGRDLQWRSLNGLELRVWGDGGIYTVLLHGITHPEEVRYEAAFSTRLNRWTTVFLPFSDFQPRLHGRIIRNWPRLDLSRLDRLSLQPGRQSPGSFLLKIRWIVARGP